MREPVPLDGLGSATEFVRQCNWMGEAVPLDA